MKLFHVTNQLLCVAVLIGVAFSVANAQTTYTNDEIDVISSDLTSSVIFSTTDVTPHTLNVSVSGEGTTITKNGAGSLTFNKTLTNTGAITISEGTVVLPNDNMFPASTQVLFPAGTLNIGSTTQNINIWPGFYYGTIKGDGGTVNLQTIGDYFQQFQIPNGFVTCPTDIAFHGATNTWDTFTMTTAGHGLWIYSGATFNGNLTSSVYGNSILFAGGGFATVNGNVTNYYINAPYLSTTTLNGTNSFNGGVMGGESPTINFAGPTTFTESFQVSASSKINVSNDFTVGNSVNAKALVLGDNSQANFSAGEISLYHNSWGGNLQINGSNPIMTISGTASVSVITATETSYATGSVNLGVLNKGTLTVKENGYLHVDGRILIAANSDWANGTLNIADNATVDLGIPGSYTYTTDPSCGVLWFGQATGTVNMNGGTLSMYGMKYLDGRGTQTFNINGGTIKAVADNNSTGVSDGIGYYFAFLPQQAKVNVKQGGITFDTGTYNVTVAATLNSSVEAGQTDGGLTKKGTGTLTLTQTPAYNGPTTVKEGTLVLNQGGTINNLSGGAKNASGEITAKAILNSLGDLEFKSADNTISSFIGTINASGKTITKTGNGQLKIWSDTKEEQSRATSFVVETGRVDFKGYFQGSIQVGVDGSDNSNVIFSPGNSVGTLNIDGDFVLKPGATLLMELAGEKITDNDMILANSFSIEEGAIVKLIPEEGTWPSTGQVFNVLLPKDIDFTKVKFDTGGFVGSYDPTTGIFAGTFDANRVPEPSTGLLLILGLMGLLKIVKSKKIVIR